MASYTVVSSKYATLSGSTADTVTLSLDQLDEAVIAVTNLDSAQLLSFTVNGSTPTQGADDAHHVPPNGTFHAHGGYYHTVVQVVGNGNAYIVQVI